MSFLKTQDQKHQKNTSKVVHVSNPSCGTKTSLVEVVVVVYVVVYYGVVVVKREATAFCDAHDDDAFFETF
jgi:hypothetical protein